MPTLTAVIIDDNWDQVKKNLKSYWTELSDEEIEALDGYESLYKKLKETYKDMSEELNDKIIAFLDSLNLMPANKSFNELKKILYLCAVEAKDRISRSLQKTTGIKDNATIQETLYYPLKKSQFGIFTLGIITGIVINKIFSKID